MSNNSDRCRLRQHANNLKKEIAAQRTAQIQTRVDDIMSDPKKMGFLAHLYTFWELEFAHAPGSTYDQQREHRALLSLDAAMSCYARENYYLAADSGDYIKNAEIPFALSHGWQAATSNARWPNFATLPHKTWKYIFFKGGQPMAGFESCSDARSFFRALEAEGHEVSTSDGYHLSKSEQREGKGNKYIALYRHNHWTVVKLHEDGTSAHSAQVMPYLCHPALEEKIARETAAFLNAQAQASESAWGKNATNKACLS